MKLKKHNVIAAIAAFVSLLVLPSLVAAQARPNPPSRPNPLGPTSDAVREMRERDMNIRRMELDRDRIDKPTYEVSKETTKQVHEDFARIQTINAEVMRDYVSGVAPDYKHISEVMAEISKRAGRLNTNLLLPSTDGDGNDRASRLTATKGRGRSPLIDLNDLICGFVTNPIFKNLNTIDIELGRQAKRDLQNIISLSDTISKSAVKLSKVTAKKN